MKELVKPLPIEESYELMRYLDETCTSGCNRVCCERVETGCQENPNRSSVEDVDILF